MIRVMAMFILTGLLTFLGHAEGEVNLTLEKALEMAIKNNAAYRVSLLQVERRRHKVRQNLDFLPVITVEGLWELDEKLMTTTVPPVYPGAGTQEIAIDFTRNFQFSFKILQPVFTGGKNGLTFQNARLDLEIAAEQARETKADMIFQVKKAYYNILVTEGLIEAHKEAAEAAEINFNNIRRRFEMGMSSRYDLLQAELALDSLQPEMSRIEKIFALSQSQLKILLGLPENAAIHIVEKLECPEITPIPEKLFQSALASLPALQCMEIEKKKNTNLLRIAYGQFFPHVSLMAAFTSRSNYFNLKPGNWQNFYTINLLVQFPIFLQWKRPAYIGELKVAEKIIDLTQEQLKDSLRLELERLILTLREEWQNIRVTRKNMDTAREGLRTARLTFDEGLLSILELTQSAGQVTRARVAHLQAVYNYVIALAELQKLTGVLAFSQEK